MHGAPVLLILPTDDQSPAWPTYRASAVNMLSSLLDVQPEGIIKQ